MNGKGTSMPTLNNDPLLTVAEAALLLAVPTKMGWRMVADGRLRSVKIGKYRRVQRSAVEALITENQRPYEPMDYTGTQRRQRS